MEQFIDREYEMETLESEYRRKGSALVIIYGRRRVGKTTLISEFIKDKNALFFLASEESEAQNRALFKEKAADFIESDLLKNADVKSWDVIFKAIMDSPFDRKPVIVMDEFQYIGKSNPCFSIHLPADMGGDSEDPLGHGHPLRFPDIHDGIADAYLLQPAIWPSHGTDTSYANPVQLLSRFFPNKSRRELIAFYAITGGVPKYIELFSETEDIYSAIQKNVLNRSGYLYDEPHFLLQQEVSEVGSYFSIIRAIAMGNSKLSAIASVLEVPATSLTKYLKTLIDLDILEREVPITEENPEKSKKGLYKIKDNYIRFWFAFVYPNMSFIESGNSGIVMKKIRSSLVSGHIAFVYEDVCRERMWELNGEDRWPFHFSKIGRWWDGKNEIDIAAIDPDGKNLILGECKFWHEPVGVNIFNDLVEKSKSITWKKADRHTWYVLFSAEGFTDELKTLAQSRGDLLLFDDVD